jgi:hypothetical protein
MGSLGWTWSGGIIDDETTAAGKRKAGKKLDEAIRQKNKSKMIQEGRGRKRKPVAGIRRAVGEKKQKSVVTGTLRLKFKK